MRIISLTCSNTEILWALGKAGELVGVDDHSDFPPDVVEGLDRVGPDLGIDVDRVARLKPDLVLASLTVPGHERVVERLERAKLPFVATEPVSISDVYADIRKIGELTGVRASAETVVRSMRAELDAPPTPTAPREPSILVEWWPKPVIVPGRLSWVNEMLRAAGAYNPLESEPVKSRAITDEEACAWDPDAVVIAWCGVKTEKYRPDVVLRRPRWQHVRAVEARSVHPVPEAFLGRPGPRLVEGVRALRRVAAQIAPR